MTSTLARLSNRSYDWHSGVAFPDDWTAEEMESKEKSFDSEESAVVYSPRFVRDIFEWAQSIFGNKAKNMTIVEIAEYWFEFAFESQV